MPVDESIKSAPRKTRIIAFLILAVIKVFSYTYRLRVVGRRDEFLGLTERDDSMVIACWHNRMFYFATYIYRYLFSEGFKLAMMSSDSKDGEIGATIGKYAGAKVVRGSSSRRGANGLRGLLRAIKRDKHSIIILPDGSKGPVYKAKVGVAALSKMTGKPILPVSCWASDYWRIRSWDRMIFPKPFARVLITVGDLVEVPRSSDDEDLDRYRVQVEGELDRLGIEATQAFPKYRPAI
ncbi:lysophospholipid acyltransferase family protein [Pelagicoccus albus]|uniref:Lysophospholipid acyltransferase family protein n=1 Tax=Pelagicoccus albus TaxID=415222 RepID=A0A7X1B702_9BACT|nr:lysophospholipid acyltransferase family protein [Pelagicoccus albus]MBC2605550.1 lysophospholipid acyltransferase family protein [Pelagicoccus albus]